MTYERVKDWWAKDLPVMKGQYNFDELRIIYYRERIAAFEAFKAGSLDYWRENSAKGWATEYEFDAVKKSYRTKAKLVHPDLRPGDEDAAKAFQALQLAYEVLRQGEERREWKG